MRTQGISWWEIARALEIPMSTPGLLTEVPQSKGQPPFVGQPPLRVEVGLCDMMLALILTRR
jgi:hypothetical protein